MAQRDIDLLDVYRREGLLAAREWAIAQNSKPLGNEGWLSRAAEEAFTTEDFGLFDLVFENEEACKVLTYSYPGRAMSDHPHCAIQMLEIMKKHGWDVQQFGHFDLFTATEDIKFVHWLIENGADPARDNPLPLNEIMSRCKTPWQTSLNLAAFHGKLDIFKLLVEHGAKVEANIPLHMAATRKNIDADWERMVDYLLSIGVDINENDIQAILPYSKGCPLAYAVECGAVDAARYLIKKGANPYIGAAFSFSKKTLRSEKIELFKTT